ncbi:hypothetical protein [Pseudomonas chlororaphis]|uniref:Uncharacterized protein n=1 Tax=Pseudomonas chlororaphis TaxID=587753 RepID=A0AAX3FUF9_9PSED|nr:hypothetical protein [Pseudomonas chlororaphis]AZC38628.1 hypothetical protein C4K37_4249 [Pseudomonas chlororaphis subsp. piscium]AZC45178.1 hypothetical protein C4K36_4261 [Pseudomonas chlororaphis subsp. piscium]WDG76110.1 hypothetical protein PUP65_21890 [Pseudomonas chlororaphis]WDH32292.1 hypothetical protein PUP81_12430 [Pseudomonas chlororaphis]WDH74630.1 hypothetical protein PUP78_21875 [Pseudomonas chlororaphis]
MSLTTTILMLIGGWLAVAAAMLWGVLRIRSPTPSSAFADSRRENRKTGPASRHRALTGAFSPTQ